MDIKFIHTADIHLGCRFEKASFPRCIAKNRRLEMWTTFEKILRICKKRQADYLLISGDLFEESLITLGEIKRINEALEKIAPTTVVINPGNHDPYTVNSPYRKIDWGKNIFIFKENMDCFEFPEKKTAIYGYPWKEKYIEDKFDFSLNLNQNYNNLLLLHGDIYNKSSMYLPIDIESLQESALDYIALGHIHKADKISEKIYYSGSPEPLDFGEIGSHGVIFGELTKGKLKTEYIPVSQREFRIENIEINPMMTYEDIKDKLLSHPFIEKDLYRFKLSGILDRDIDIESLIEDINQLFYHVEFQLDIFLDYDLDKISYENRDNIIGLFIEEMRKKDLWDEITRDALYIGLQALLEEIRV